MTLASCCPHSSAFSPTIIIPRFPRQPGCLSTSTTPRRRRAIALTRPSLPPSRGPPRLRRRSRSIRCLPNNSPSLPAPLSARRLRRRPSGQLLKRTHERTLRASPIQTLSTPTRTARSSASPSGLSPLVVCPVLISTLMPRFYRRPRQSIPVGKLTTTEGLLSLCYP